MFLLAETEYWFILALAFIDSIYLLALLVSKNDYQSIRMPKEI
jgi:hypothetical protein